MKYWFKYDKDKMHSVDNQLSAPDYYRVVEGEMKGKVISVRKYGTFCGYDDKGKHWNFYHLKRISRLKYLISKLFQ